jgi:hypothetical protein
MVNEWQAVKEPLATTEASTSMVEQAVISGGEAEQMETIAEDVDVSTV